MTRTYPSMPELHAEHITRRFGQLGSSGSDVGSALTDPTR